MMMASEVVYVTPEMATGWLEKNASFQRKVRSTIVDRYARDMAGGKWRLTHQGVAFDCEGRLIDGQHRLWAVVKSGVTVRMLVVRNAPEAAFDHVDLGFSRTVTDVLKAQGEGWITGDYIAVARFMECGIDVNALSVNRSPFEVREMVEAHREAIEFVFDSLDRRHVRGVTVAPVLAAIGVAYYHEVDRDRLSEFVRILVSGVAQEPARDTVVIRLRDWLRENGGSAASTERNERFLKTQRAIKAFMTNERITRIYTPAECVYPVQRRVIQ